jgi:NAD(P)H dehydrogenase (quinone)
MAMRVLVLYAHPDPVSFGAALHEAALASLRRAGHEVDDCDLHAEGFDPVLGREERVGYHDLANNRSNVAGYVDRVFLPGVSFKLVDGKVRPNLWNIRRLVAVTSYGGTRWRALLMGDPPRKLVCRAVRAVCHPAARLSYLAHYDMNRSTLESRRAFLAKVENEIGKI